MLDARRFIASVLMLVVVVGAVNAQLIGQLIKVIGVGAVVKQFGPDMNKALNKLTHHEDSERSFTKVVPIISLGFGSRKAIGACQVMGRQSAVERVKAVASPEADLLSKQIVVRAMIPVDTDNPTDISSIKAVDGVGVSGLVDLKL